MSIALFRSPKALAAAIGIGIALYLGLLAGAPSQANASLSNYCSNQTLGNHQACWGAPRTMYATYGWGDQHSVCVWVTTTNGGGPYGGFACSSGPGAGAYQPAPFTSYFYPTIENNATGSNLVHGVAYQP
jgi:hypothetical protein